MHYYDGQYPDSISIGSPWSGAKLTPISTAREVQPGFWLFSMYADVPGARELNELSMAITTPEALVLMGCSHPVWKRYWRVLRRSTHSSTPRRGGSLRNYVSRKKVQRTADFLHDTFRDSAGTPGHCTARTGVFRFHGDSKDRCDRAGIGFGPSTSVIRKLRKWSSIQAP